MIFNAKSNRANDSHVICFYNNFHGTRKLTSDRHQIDSSRYTLCIPERNLFWLCPVPETFGDYISKFSQISKYSQNLTIFRNRVKIKL